MKLPRMPYPFIANLLMYFFPKKYSLEGLYRHFFGIASSVLDSRGVYRQALLEGSFFMQLNCHFRYRGIKTRVQNWLSPIFEILMLKFEYFVKYHFFISGFCNFCFPRYRKTAGIPPRLDIILGTWEI